MTRKTRKPKTTTYTRGMEPTKERQQKNGGVISEPIYEKNDNKTYINRYSAKNECTLDHYLDGNKILKVEHTAGIIFARAYQIAVLHIRVDDRSGSHGDVEMAYINPIHSERLLRQAYAVLSPAQKTLIINVCGHDFGVGDTNRLKTFKRGLAELVKLWKLS